MQKLVAIAFSAVILMACGFQAPNQSEQNQKKPAKQQNLDLIYTEFIKKFPIQEKMKLKDVLDMIALYQADKVIKGTVRTIALLDKKKSDKYYSAFVRTEDNVTGICYFNSEKGVIKEVWFKFGNFTVQIPGRMRIRLPYKKSDYVMEELNVTKP